MESLKVGTEVRLLSTGKSYGGGGRDCWFPTIKEYIKRYRPCNARLSSSNGYVKVKVNTGYNTTLDLALRTDLKWKVRCYVGLTHNNGKIAYIISSNKNHMLIITEEGITPINLL